MLEKQLAALLATNLGLFLRDLNEDQLQISLWTGEVRLQNLELQPNILERLTEMLVSAKGSSPVDAGADAAARKALLLPFTVVRGVIQELRLHIPWMSLDSEAVRVEVTGVELVFAPLRAKPFSPDEETRRREAMKEQQLVQYETRRQATTDAHAARKPVTGADTQDQDQEEDYDAFGVRQPSRRVSPLRSTETVSSPSSPTSSGFVQRLLQGVYRNVRVTTRHISVRYIVDYPGLDPSLACALSLWVEEVYYTPTSTDFKQPAFLPDAATAATATGGNSSASARGGNGARDSAANSGGSRSGAASASDVECHVAHFTNIKVAVHAHRRGDAHSDQAVPSPKCASLTLHTFAQAWQHSETLVDCDAVTLQVKRSMPPPAPYPGNGDQPDASASPIIDLVVTLGEHLNLDASFGAMALLAHITTSITEGFSGVSYRHHLPLLSTAPRTPANAHVVARSRWAYAIACVLQDIRRARRLDDYASDRPVALAEGNTREQRASVRLDRIVAFGRLRREYCDLWKRSRSFYWLPPLDVAEAARMHVIESEASLAQLVLLRAFAYAEIDVEHAERAKQDAWIAEKTGRATRRSVSSSSSPRPATTATRSSKSGLLRWFGLGDGEADVSGETASVAQSDDADAVLQRRVESSGGYVFRDLSASAEPLFVSFEAEWGLAREFLDERRAAHAPRLFSLKSFLAPPPPPTEAARATESLSVAVATARPVVSLRVIASRVTVAVRAQYHAGLEAVTAAVSPHLFLQHVDQRLIFQLRGVEWFICPDAEPREDKARTSLFIKSFSAHFAGVLNTPLILSRECARPQHGWNPGHSAKSEATTAFVEEDFLVVKENATRTRLTVVMASFVVVARPLHELFWWTHDVCRLVEHLAWILPVSDPAPAVPTTTPTSAAATTPIRVAPLIDCTIAPFALLVPLFSHDLSFTDLESFSHAHFPSSPNSVIGSLNSTAAPDDGSAASFGSVASVFGTSVSSERLILRGEPCLILSVPSGVRVTTVTGADKRHPGPEREFYVRVGDESKSVRLSCQTRAPVPLGTSTTTAATAADGTGRLPTTRRKDIFSFSMLEIVSNPTEVGVVLEMGMELTLDPHVVGLINDELLRPGVLYGTMEQMNATASLWTNATASRDEWQFPSAHELILRHGEAAFTLRDEDARHYVSLLAEHHARQHPGWRQLRTGGDSHHPSACHAHAVKPPHTPRKRISVLASFVRLRLCDERGLELMEAEFVNPDSQDVPEESMPYREAFSFFSAGPRALELFLDLSNHDEKKTIFACVPDISISTALGASVATLTQLCLTVRQEASGDVHVSPSLRAVRLVMGAECRRAVQLLARVLHTLTLPDVEAHVRDVLGPSRLPPPASPKQPQQQWQNSPNFLPTIPTAVSAAPPDTKQEQTTDPAKAVYCTVTVGTAAVLLPLSREMGMAGCALDLSLRDLRVSVQSLSGPPLSDGQTLEQPEYKTRCDVEALLTEAVRVDEEDDTSDQSEHIFDVLGPLLRTERAASSSRDTPRGATVHVSALIPFPSSSSSTSSSSSSEDEPPEVHIAVSNGHLCAYMPFILHLFYTAKDPLYTELVVAQQIAAKQGYLSNRLLVPRRPVRLSSDELSGGGPDGTDPPGRGYPDTEEENAADRTAAVTVALQQIPKLALTLTNVELFLPTNEVLPVDVCDDSTYFLLFAEKLTMCERRLRDEQGVLQRRLVIESSSLHYHDGSMGPLLPMLAQLTVTLEFGVLLLPKQQDTIASNFQYVKAAPGDVCVRVSVTALESDTVNTDQKPQPQTRGRIQAAPLSLTLQASRVISLVEMIQFNLGRPLFPPGVMASRPPGASTIVVTTAPLIVVVTDHRESPMFRVQLTDGFQYYKAGGGQWECCPSQRVFLSGMCLEACTGDTPRLLWCSAARMITEIASDPLKLNKSISTVVEIDSAEFSLDAPRCWLALYDLILQPCQDALANPVTHRTAALSRQVSSGSLCSRSGGFGNTNCNAQVTVDLRVGVRNITARLGERCEPAQLVLEVPELLVSLHSETHAPHATVVVRTTSTSPPSLRIGGTDARRANAIELLSWTEDVQDGPQLVVSADETQQNTSGVGLEVVCEIPTKSPKTPERSLDPAPLGARLCVTLRRLCIVPHLQAYIDCLRLVQASLPELRRLLSERNHLKQTFETVGDEDPTAQQQDREEYEACAAEAAPQMEFVVEKLTVMFPSDEPEPAAREAASTCWLEVDRVETVVAAEKAGDGVAMDNAHPTIITAQLQTIRLAFSNYYPIVVPVVTVQARYTTAPSADVAVDVAVFGSVEGEHEGIYFSTAHLITLATQMRAVRAKLPELVNQVTQGNMTLDDGQHASPQAASWSVNAAVRGLNVVLTSSEYTTGDHRLRLTCDNPIVMSVAPTTTTHTGPAVVTPVQLDVTVSGACRLSNGDDDTLAYRAAVSARRPIVDVEDSRLLVTSQKRADHSGDSRATFTVSAVLGNGSDSTVTLSTDGIRICATHDTLAYVRDLAKVLRPELERLVHALDIVTQAPVEVAAAPASASSLAPRLRLTVHSIAAELGEDALVEVCDVHLGSWDMQRMQAVLKDEDEGEQDATLTVGSLLLRARQSGLVHACVERPSLTLRRDHVLRIVVPRVLLMSDGSPFFVDLLHSALMWQAFVRTQATTTPGTDQAPSLLLRGVAVDVHDVRVQCHNARRAAATAKMPPHVELQVASLVVRRVLSDDEVTTTTTSTSPALWHTTVDAKGCVVVVKDAQDGGAADGDALPPPIVQRLDVSVKVEPGRDEASGTAQDQVTVRISPVTVHLPMGDTLAHCTDALGRAVLPLVQYFRSGAAYRVLANRPAAREAVRLAVSHDAEGRIVSAVPQERTLVRLSSTIPGGVAAAATVAADGVGEGVRRGYSGADHQSASFFRFSIYVPHVTVAFLDTASNRRDANESAHHRPRKSHRLFAGVEVGEVSVERARGAQSNVLLLSLRSINSHCEQANLFSFRTMCPADTVAVQWRDETLRFPSLDADDTDVEKHAHTVTVSDAEVAVSPAFLIVLNERCVAPIAAGLSAAILANVQDEFQSEAMRESATGISGDVLTATTTPSTRSAATGALSYQPYQEPLDVDSDLLLQRDLVLGGPSGIQLQFCKSSVFGARNTLTVRSLNHARLILIPMPATGDAPVHVQEGLTVIVESTPVVLVAPSPSRAGVRGNDTNTSLGLALNDYVNLGPRSVFLVPDAALVRFETHASASLGTGVSGSGSGGGGGGAGGREASWNGRSGLRRRKLHRCHDLRLSLGLDARLQAHHEYVQLRVQTIGSYTRETLTVRASPDGPSAADTVRLLVEQGDLETTHLWLACSDGPVTEETDAVTVHVRRQGNARTVAHVLIAPLAVSLSRNHLRLLYEALVQITHSRTRLRDVGRLLPVATTTATHDAVAAAASSLSTKLGGTVVLGGTGAETETSAASLGKDDSASDDDGLGDREDDDNTAEAAATAVEVRLTAPQIKVLVGDDFFTPLVAVALEAVTLAASGDRLLQAVAGIGTFTLNVTDFPTAHGQSRHPRRPVAAPSTAPRTLLTVSPELSMQLDQFHGGGLSVSVSLDCGHVEATVPLTRLLHAAQYPWEIEHAVKPLTFKNLLGLPLLLLTATSSASSSMSTGPSASDPSTPMGAPAFCYVPSGGVQPLTSLLRCGQTVLRLVHEAEPPKPANLFDRLSYLYAVGTEVDLRQLSNGHTCRFALEGSSGVGVSTGVLDVVLRFDATHRVISATSAVKLINELDRRVVQWPSVARDTDQPTLVLMPAESAYMTLPALQHGLSVAVDGGTYAYNASDESLPLHAILTAWSQYTPTHNRREHHAHDPTALRLPLRLTRQHRQDETDRGVVDGHDDKEDVLAVQLVVEKQLAKQSYASAGGMALFRKYELCCRLQPVATVVNLIGLTVTLELLLVPERSAAPRSEMEIRRVVLEHGARFDWFPSSAAEAANPPHCLLKIHVPGSLVQRQQEQKEEEGEDTPRTTAAATTLDALEPFPLFHSAAAAQLLLPVQQQPNARSTAAARPVASVLAHRVSASTVQLLPLAVVENTLNVPIRVCVADKPSVSAVLAGTVAQVYPGERLPVLWPTHKSKEKDYPVKVRVAAGTLGSEPSDPIFIHGTISPIAAMLSSREAQGGVHIFSATVSSATHSDNHGRTPAVMTVVALWRVRNEHPSLSLRVRPTLRDTAFNNCPYTEVEPLAEAPLVFFHGATSGRFVEPCAAFQYVLPPVPSNSVGAGAPLAFAWSTPIFLGEVATAASYVTLRHDLVPCADSVGAPSPPVSASQSSAFTVFQDRSVPSYYGDVVSDHYFACMMVNTKVDAGSCCAFHVHLVRGSEPAPVQIENRTGYTLQCGQCLPAPGDVRTTLVGCVQSATVRDVVVAPYTDCATCWAEPFLGMPVLRITAYSNSGPAASRKHHTTTQDLRRLASANEPVALGDSALFVYVSAHRCEPRCFVVTVMDTRKLASQLLFFPRLVAHVDIVVKRLSLFVASQCVRADCSHLAATPLGVTASRGLVRGIPTSTSSSASEATTTGATTAQEQQEREEIALETLKHEEFDIVLLRLSNLGVTAITNEKYLLVGVGVGGLALQDCTSPSPRFPLILRVDPLPETNGDGTPLALVGSVQLQRPHFGQPHVTNAAPSTWLSAASASPARAPAPLMLPIEEISAAVGTVTVQLDDRFLMVCREAYECARVVGAEASSQYHTDKSIVAFTESLSVSAVSRELEADETDSFEVTARGLLVTQRALRVREKHTARMVDCYVSFLRISPLRATLTLTLAQGEGWQPFEGLPVLGQDVPSIDRAPLNLKELTLHDVVRRGDSLGALLVGVLWSVYRGQVFVQACRVIGSLAILGNPLALAEGWSRGIRTLFDDAVVHRQPLVGTRSFLAQVTASTLHSVGLISGAGSRALFTLAGSSNTGSFSQSDRTAAGLTARATGHHRRSSRFLRDLASSVTGVVMQPIRGALQSGVQGFLSGVASGLFGVVTRPVAGALSDVSGAVESVAQQLQSAPSDGKVGAVAGTAQGATTNANTLVLQDGLAERNFVSASPQDSQKLNSSSSLTSVLPPSDDRSGRAYRFVSAGVYQAVLSEASRKGLFHRDAARYVIGIVGAHSYALYATYKAFLHDTTPEEFSCCVAIALDAHLARELPRLLSARAFPTGSSASSYSDSALSLERARNIKVTLGIPALLKHASLEEVVQVCTLNELRANVVPADLQSKCGPLLAHRVVLEMIQLLNPTAL